VAYDSNVSNIDPDVETEENGVNRSIMHSTNPFKNEVRNDNFNIDSKLSKPKDSRYNTNDPSYITQFNDNDAFLAVGSENRQPKTHEKQMDELREYFKKKIVNAYNSLYLEDTGRCYTFP
jgi:hypothetical protein